MEIGTSSTKFAKIEYLHYAEGLSFLYYCIFHWSGLPEAFNQYIYLSWIGGQRTPTSHGQDCEVLRGSTVFLCFPVTETADILHVSVYSVVVLL